MMLEPERCPIVRGLWLMPNAVTAYQRPKYGKFFSAMKPEGSSGKPSIGGTFDLFLLTLPGYYCTFLPASSCINSCMFFFHLMAFYFLLQLLIWGEILRAVISSAAKMKKSPLPVHNICGTEKKIWGKEDLVKILRWHFGHSEFRGKQLEAIEAVLSGRDCFCLMPTGGGKSMCYQIPALAKKGIVLIVCPLIALMENQVMALKEKSIAAEFLSSTQTPHARNKIYEDLESGRPTLKLLYVTPELIATPGFSLKLSKIYDRGLLHLIAIDEAHCISTWGHDFRPSYRKLSSLRNCLPDVPILALTATAVPRVQRDVVESLSLRNPLILKSSFNRPNIYYEVRYKDLLHDPYDDLCIAIKSCGDVCAIVYCLERTTCDALAAHLSDNGLSCAAYHAGLNNKLRSSILDDWISSKIQIVVATVAFGMGIDRKDVRVVCHFNIPKSMEAFYQESGRAGRDQLPSQSLLYYGIDDRKRMEFILSNAESKKSEYSILQDGSSRRSLVDFKQVIEYCEGSNCRRKKILESFGEEVSELLCKKTCDACKHPNIVAKQLGELNACNVHVKNRLPQIFISSSSDMVDGKSYSEFWNRGDDESCGSEEEISESDDDLEISTSLTSSKLQPKSCLNEKMDILQRAEENYYRRNGSENKIGRPDKNSISNTLRDSSKERLSDALKKAKQRLGSLKIDFETAVTFLENECYKKYGKSGKSFYISQLAGTVRWLSTATLPDLMNRLGATTTSVSTSENPASKTIEEVHGSVGLSPPPVTLPSQSIISRKQALPSIPSFSEFPDSRKGKGCPSYHLSSSKEHSSGRVRERAEKRTRML